MFSTQGKLSKIPCPAYRNGTCEAARTNCPLSHDPNDFPPPAKDDASIATSSKGSLVVGAASASKGANDSVLNGIIAAGKKSQVLTYPVAGSSSSVLGKRPSSAIAATGEMPKKKASRNAYQAGSSGKSASPSGSNAANTPPSIKSSEHPASSKIALTARQASLKAIYNAFISLYQALSSCPDPDISLLGQELARRDSLAQELEVFKASNEHSYKNSARSSIVGIGNRDKARLERAVSDSLHEKAKAGIFVRYHIDRCTEIGTQSEVSRKRMEAVNKAKGRLSIPKLKEKLFVCPFGALSKWGYITEIPEEWGEGGTNPDSLGGQTKCDRCGAMFVIKVPDTGPGEGSEAICSFHFGRKRPTDSKDPLTRRKMLAWTCCGRFANDSTDVDDKKCCTAPSHVFKEEEGAKLHSRQAFIRSKDLLPDKGMRPAAHDVLALDCELCYTTAGMSLTELCVVDSDGRVLLDLMVRPPASFLDYNTRFSGISAESYAQGKVVYTLDEARKKLLELMHVETVLVGHGLENDLKALRLVHTSIVDTVMLFPHPRGPPFRMSLRELTSKHLGKIIQASASEGHDASIDASAALELLRWKLIHEPEFSPFRSPSSDWYRADPRPGTGQAVTTTTADKGSAKDGSPMKAQVSAKSLAAITASRRN